MSKEVFAVFVLLASHIVVGMSGCMLGEHVGHLKGQTFELKQQCVRLDEEHNRILRSWNK